MAPSRTDVRDADDWWATLSDKQRVGYHRWLTGQGKLKPPTQPETLFDMEPVEPEETE